MADGDGAAKAKAAGEDRGSELPVRVLSLFLAVRFCSTAANNTQAVAVGWYIYALTSSAMDLGLIGLAQFLPIAGLALIAGHAADRYPRRRVLLTAMAIETLCSLGLAGLALSGAARVAPIYLLILLNGAARAFETPALLSLLPGLVRGPAFPRATAWSSLASQSAVVIGPALGGLLFLLGAAVPFFAVALLLCLALTAMAMLPDPRRESGSAPLSREGLLSGVRFIWRNEVVRGAVSLDLFAVLFGGATALLPIFARDILMIGPAGLGLLRSAPALGATVSGFILTRRPPQRRIGRSMLAAVTVYGIATLAFGMSRDTLVSVLALMAVGAADMVSVVIRHSMIQIASPDAIRGRVTAVNQLFTGTSSQLGQFESGVTAAWFGPVGSVVFGGAATLLIVALWLQRFPSLRRMDRFALAEG